jgi:hypothetical protein
MNNEKAFPNPHLRDDSGITMRDYFAAKAMSSVMPAVLNELKKTRGSVKEAIILQALSAKTCYSMADAMMKAREE